MLDRARSSVSNELLERFRVVRNGCGPNTVRVQLVSAKVAVFDTSETDMFSASFLRIHVGQNESEPSFFQHM